MAVENRIIVGHLCEFISKMYLTRSSHCGPWCESQGGKKLLTFESPVNYDLMRQKYRLYIGTD